jgi:hypothetical protein
VAQLFSLGVIRFSLIYAKGKRHSVAVSQPWVANNSHMGAGIEVVEIHVRGTTGKYTPIPSIRRSCIFDAGFLCLVDCSAAQEDFSASDFAGRDKDTAPFSG